MFHVPNLVLLSHFFRCQIMQLKSFQSMSCCTLRIREKCCHCSARMFLEEAPPSRGENISHISSGPIPTRTQGMHILFGFGPRNKPSITLVCFTTRLEFFNISILICLRCTPHHLSRMLPKQLMVCMLIRCLLSIVATIPSSSRKFMPLCMSLGFLRIQRLGNLIT